MLPISLSAVVLIVASLDALRSEIFSPTKLTRNGSERRLGALAILLWVLPIWTGIWTPMWLAEPQMEPLWTIYLVGGVLAGYLAWKGILQWSMFSALLLVFAFRQIALFTQSESANVEFWWQLGAVTICALLQWRMHWRSAALAGLLALGLWRSPVLGLTLVFGVALSSQLVLKRRNSGWIL